MGANQASGLTMRPLLAIHNLCLKAGIGTCSQLAVMEAFPAGDVAAWELCVALEMKSTSVHRTLTLLRQLDLIVTTGRSVGRKNRLSPTGAALITEIRNLLK